MRRTRLTELAGIDATLVMFRSGNRVQDTLADLAEIMGGRDAAICRRRPKYLEEVKRAPISGAGGSRRLAGNTRRIRAGDRPAAGRCASDGRRPRRALACIAAARQRPGRGGARGQTVGTATPRRLCPRARAGQEIRSDDGKDGATPSDATAKLTSPARVAAFHTGVSAETRAAAFLMAKGYRILAKRFLRPMARSTW